MGKIFTEERTRNFFKTMAEIRERIKEIALFCTKMTIREEIKDFWIEDDGNIHLIAFDTTLSDGECYTFPIEYLSMSLGAIDLAEQEKERIEAEFRSKKELEEQAERAEYERLKKKYG